MLERMIEKSKELHRTRENVSVLRSRMKLAEATQLPELLLISPIDRSGQDVELLGLGQCEAFNGTRVTGQVLLPPERYNFLVGGPVAYNSHFPRNKAVILTFDRSESDEVVMGSIANLGLYPGLKDVPVVAFRVDYEDGIAEVITHSHTRDESLEDEFLKRTVRPRPSDRDALVFACSDSRVHPPDTDYGLPMAIQTLGGHIPEYTGNDDETKQLDAFFADWLSQKTGSRQFILLAHGSHDYAGGACGAAKASMNPDEVHGEELKSVVVALATDCDNSETAPSKNPHERAIALARAVKKNLMSYPSLKKAEESGFVPSKQIQGAIIDTVTGQITEIITDRI